MRQSNVHKPDDQLPYVGIGVRPIHIAKFVFSTMVLSLFQRGLLEIIIIDLLTSNWLFIIALPVSLLTFLWCYFSNMDAFEKLHHKKESQDTVQDSVRLLFIRVLHTLQLYSALMHCWPFTTVLLNTMVSKDAYKCLTVRCNFVHDENVF